jgi:hypothetical protein
MGREVAGIPQLASVDDLEALPESDVLLLVDVDATRLHPSWADELASVAVQPGTGLVTPAMLDSAGRSTGAGYGARDATLWPLLAGERWSLFTRASQVAWPRNVLAVGGCAAVRVGLARELLAQGASPDPVSLSLAAHRRGLRNVYWPFARVRTEDRLPPVAMSDPVDDPYLNPNLPPGAVRLT